MFYDFRHARFFGFGDGIPFFNLDIYCLDHKQFHGVKEVLQLRVRWALSRMLGVRFTG